MGRLIVFSLCLLVFASIGNAQGHINYDQKSTEQVLLNTASQKTIEYLHTETVDTIQKRQRRLGGLVGSLSTYKTLFKLTLDNAKGFGVRSGIYKSIVATSGDIVAHSAAAVEAIGNTNLTGKAITLFKVAELVTEAAHLGNMFFDIVTNATVPNPLVGKMEGSKEAKKDERNLLNRHERLKMALDIRLELKKIDHQLVMLTYYCKHNSLSDLLLTMDRKTWITYHYANFSSKQIINQWNKLLE